MRRSEFLKLVAASTGGAAAGRRPIGRSAGWVPRGQKFHRNDSEFHSNEYLLVLFVCCCLFSIFRFLFWFCLLVFAVCVCLCLW